MTTRRTRGTRATGAIHTTTRRPVEPATSAAVGEDVVGLEADAAEAAHEVEGVLGVADDAAPQSIDSLPPSLSAGGVAAGGTAEGAAPTASVSPPPCRHQVTRTRSIGRGVERYCERCGVVTGNGVDVHYTRLT